MRSPVRRLIARAIKEIIRRHDIAARYGDDEFAIILPDTTLQAAEEVAERLQVEANVAQT
jgi:diguanylate cyclase (GGDEF)-like protein